MDTIVSPNTTSHTTQPDTAENGEPGRPVEAAALPLERFLPGNPDGGNPTVTLQEGGVDVVVLDHRDETAIEVCHDGEIVAFRPDALAVPVTDPTRQAALLRQAVTSTVAGRRALAVRNQTLQSAIDANRADHALTLDRIRSYAIQSGHLEGPVCFDGLNAFLSEFGLAEYNPRVRVKFTITGSYEIDGADKTGAEHDAHNHLRVDFGEVPDFIDDSDEHTVSVDAVETIND